MPLSAFLVREPGVIVLLALFPLCLVSGCVSEAHRETGELTGTRAIERNCGPVQNVQRTIVPTDASSFRRNAQEGMLYGDGSSGRFSQEAQAVSDILGAKDLLQMAAFEAEAAKKSEGPTLQLLQVQQYLSNRVVLAFLEVARTAAEIDCEEERADQLADRLQETRDTRVRRFTLLAIIIDALVTVMAGVLTLIGRKPAAVASAISGGLLATALGTAALFTGGEHDFRHKRNLLKEVWEAPSEPVLVPLPVWRFLNQPLSDDEQQRSLRDTLISRWREDGRLGKPGSEIERRRLSLLFGEGGSYAIEDLRARAAMLDLFEADVNLMSEHLQILMSEVVRIQSVPHSIQTSRKTRQTAGH